MARDLGWTDEEITSMSAAELNNSVRMAYKTTLQRQQQERANEQALLHTQARAEVPAPEPEDAVDWGEDENETGEKYKVEDKHIYKPVAKVVKELTKKVKQLEKQLNAANGREWQRHVESVHEKLDRAFEELGSEYHGVFGDGPITDFDQKSPEARRRRAVVDSLTGLDPNSRGYVQKLKAAAKELFSPGAAAPKPAPEPTYDVDEERWNRGALATPTSRQPPPEPKGPKRAEAAIARLQRERAAAEAAGGDDEVLNGLLG